MTEKEQQFNQWFDQYANGVKVFEEVDMKQAYLQGRAELEKENAELKDYNKKLLQSDIDKQNKIVLLSQKVNDLQKKNAELDCQKNRNKACYSCVNATERCFTNEIGCPCEKYKSYKDENEELNEKLLEQKQYTEFKCNESVKKKEVYEKEHFLLTKAKELLKKCVCIINRLTPTTALLDKNERSLLKQVEQFLNEVEK